MSVDALRTTMREADFVEVQVVSAVAPTLPNSRPQSTVSGKASKFAAQAWNLGATLLPDGLPWSTSLWAVGRADDGK